MLLALAQMNSVVGDIAANSASIIDLIGRGKAARADCIVFPELALCGYPPKDLLLQSGFIAACSAAAKSIGEKHSSGITVIFGVPLPASGSDSGGICNSLVAYRDGKFIDYYDKRLLPTYDVFDEDRYFRPGDKPCVISVPTSGGVMRVGLSICEDLWKGEDVGFSWRYEGRADPVPELVAAGAQVIVNPSASPFVLGKGQRHRDILRKHAKAHKVCVAAVNVAGANDDLIFDGHAAVYSGTGTLIAAGRGFAEDLVLVDTESTSAVPDPLSSSSEPALAYHALVLGVRDYLGKTGFKQSLIGLSGGIDSALTACIAATALGPSNVLGVAMPGPYSSEHSVNDAYELAARLGITCITAGINPAVEGFRGTLNDAFGKRELKALGEVLPDITEENLQSRCRGTVLMGLSNRSGAMVLTTGNKSEMAVGYCTLYGDMNGGLAVLSDVSKQLVYAMSKWINQNPKDAGFNSPPIPESTITKPPSAELRPDQTDQDSLPPYEVLDRIIELYVERRKSSAEIIELTRFDAAVVQRMIRLIDLSEYKRKQAAVGLKVSSVAFGSGRRVPIAQRWKP